LRRRIERLAFSLFIAGVLLMLGSLVYFMAPPFIAAWYVAPTVGRVFIAGAFMALLALGVGLASI